MDLGDPEETGGGGVRLNPKDIVGHLLLVWVIEYIEHSPTQFSRPDRPSDVIVVDVVDLDQKGEDLQPGLLARKTWWRQALLIQTLRPRVGKPEPVLVAMGKGVAGMGKAAPYQLTNMRSAPTCVAQAQEWAARNPDFVPSTPGRAMPSVEQDPWNQQVPADRQAFGQPQQQLPPPRPVTPQELTILERMARQSVPPQNQEQGPIPF